MMKQFKRLFSLLTFLFITVVMFGQATTTSGINGRIVDPSGKPLPGATMTVYSQFRGCVREDLTRLM
jgi:hypothetical protein